MDWEPAPRQAHGKHDITVGCHHYPVGSGDSVPLVHLVFKQEVDVAVSILQSLSSALFCLGITLPMALLTKPLSMIRHRLLSVSRSLVKWNCTRREFRNSGTSVVYRKTARAAP